MTTRKTMPDPEPDDPFDPARLRERAQVDVAVEKVLSTVPVRKPGKNEFFRVHPDEAYVTEAQLLTHEDDFYLVVSEVEHLVADELRAHRLAVCANKDKVCWLWPMKLPLEDSDLGRRWALSRLEAAELAKTSWIKIKSNRALGAYEVYRAKGDYGDPVWPDMSLRDLLAKGFGDRLIDRPDHPVIRQINGEL